MEHLISEGTGGLGRARGGRHLLLRGTALGSWRHREHNNAEIVILLAVIFNMIVAFPADYTSFSTAYFVQVSANKYASVLC